MNVYKILRKLGIGYYIYKFARLFIKNKHYQIDDNKVKYIEQYIESRLTSKTSSIVLKREYNEIYDLDIIVPCYNQEKYVKDCIDSIIRSIEFSGYNVRIIAIDDGSTDNTGEILDNFQFSNLLVIHQKNKGFSGARNSGLDMVQAKYIMFVDSDDKITRESIKILLDKATYANDDVVIGGYRRIYNDKISKRSYMIQSNEINAIPGFPWAKLYKSYLWNGIRFNEGFLFEDTIIRMIILPMAKKISCINNVVYLYRYNLNSISHAKQNSRFLDSTIIYLQLIEDRFKLELKNSEIDFKYFKKHVFMSTRRVELCSKETNELNFLLWYLIWNKYFYKEYQNKTDDIIVSFKNNNYKLFKLCALLGGDKYE